MLNFKISWTAPNRNYGEITNYIVKIAHSGSPLYSQELTNCDGSDPTIVALNYCLIPSTVLREEPFNY